MDNRKFRWGRAAMVPLAVTGALFLAACGGDDEDPAEETTTSTATSEASGTTTSTATEAATETATGTAAATETATQEAAGETIEVTTVDYAFEGLPETIAAGSQIVLTNESEAEVHEFVVIPFPEGETRSAEELIQLPEEELMAMFAGEPAAVIVAMPGTGPDENIVALGDGTLSEPGRYIVVCSIPVGADPQAFLEAAQGGGDGPPAVEGGAPHFTEGMYAEVTVE